MNDTRNAADTPRAWVGCLACYNAGRLVGECFDGVEAGEATPEDVHSGRVECTCPRSALLTTHDPECPVPSAGARHEELWVFDHEGYGALIPGECSPAEAQAKAEELAVLPQGERAAFAAYAGYVGAEYADVEGFREAYAGEWESALDYAYAYVEDTGMLHGVDDTIARYFDYQGFARDLELGGDICTMPAGNGYVYVFRTL